jgi:hypothetical protein
MQYRSSLRGWVDTWLLHELIPTSDKLDGNHQSGAVLTQNRRRKQYGFVATALCPLLGQPLLLNDGAP